MNHDFICYIIISTIKIPHRLKNNFRYNYTVILYNNIIFRFSFQIRCSDERTHRSGSEKIHYFFSCCKFHIDFFIQCHIFSLSFFCLFCKYANEHARNGSSRYLRARSVSFLFKHYSPKKKKISIRPFVSRGCEEFVSSVSLFISFFWFVCSFLHISRRVRAGPPFSAFVFPLFPFSLFFIVRDNIEILD